MTFTISGRLARLAHPLRIGVLAAFALLVAHDAIFMAEYGIGDRFAVVMAERGHDGYWLPFTLLAGAAGLGALFVGLAFIARLQGRAAPLADPGADRPSYLRELARTWRLLLPIVAALFAAQENLEHLLTHGQLIGLDPLGGAGYELALPVLAATTFVLAAVGSLVRWRIAVLRARIAASGPRARRPLRPARAAREWLLTIATRHRWMLDRRDVGRAPPSHLRPNRFAAA